MTENEVCKRRKEYFRELIGDDFEKDISIDTEGIEARREKWLYGRGRQYKRKMYEHQ